MSSFHKMFMERMVRGLVEQKIPEYVVPCDSSPTGKRLTVPDPSSILLADIREQLAERAEKIPVSHERFEEYFETHIVPAYQAIVPRVLARV